MAVPLGKQTLPVEYMALMLFSRELYWWGTHKEV